MSPVKITRMYQNCMEQKVLRFFFVTILNKRIQIQKRGKLESKNTTQLFPVKMI